MTAIKLSSQKHLSLCAYLHYVNINTVTTNNGPNFPVKAVPEEAEFPHRNDVGTVAKPNCNLPS